MRSSSSASLLHAAARHEAGHAILAELFAGLRGIPTPIIRRVDILPDGTGGVQYVDTPSVPDTLKPRLCIAHAYGLLRAGSPFIWDAVCDMRIAQSQDAYNGQGPAALDKTLASVARDIGLACRLPAGTAFDVDVLYDWLTVHEAIPPPGNSPAFGDGDHARAGYADASYFVGSLLTYAGYTDRRAIAADLLVVLAGPAAEGSSIHAPACASDLFVSGALFAATHAVNDPFVSTKIQDATRTALLKITTAVLNQPPIKAARHALEALLIARREVSGDVYTAWATEVRGLSAGVQQVLHYALDTAETLLIPGA